MNFSLFDMVAGMVGAGVLYTALRSARTYFKFRGKRLVTCPESQQTAAVEMNAKEAAREAALGKPRFRLSQCSRWPERRACGQQCLNQIEEAPEDCLVRNIVARWYKGKTCVYCGKPIREVNEWWVEHKPALGIPREGTIFWDEIPPEKLPEAFSTDAPVCWSCHIAETFRQRFPQQVTDRPPSKLRIRF